MVANSKQRKRNGRSPVPSTRAGYWSQLHRATKAFGMSWGPSAAHAEDALASLETHATVIHVLFTDIHMPGTMDGLALAHHAARSWPWIALLITSGLASPDGSTLLGQRRFLPKPYHPAHAIRHIREWGRSSI
jgi:CheY-like chemotaxis protein